MLSLENAVCAALLDAELPERAGPADRPGGQEGT